MSKNWIIGISAAVIIIIAGSWFYFSRVNATKTIIPAQGEIENTPVEET